uniref:UBC core domain-containing protein n=1 Tax=Timema genevievae TaxID=629358 RepID=A0A7R9JZR3_TIMGE|nr:unnamed protein product [Timema genevievae]
MAAEHQYFYEDEVFRINRKGNIEFGMVLENSELVSSDENSDVEEGGRMKKGHIRVAWHPSGVEEVIPEKKEFATDIVACLDSWVGGIKTVHSKLLLQCADGSRCIVNDIEACGLVDFNEKRDCECEFPSRREEFYPGQTLYGPLHVLEDAQWIHCTKDLKTQMSKPNKTVKVLVEEVQTDSVGIHWQCRAYSKEGAGLDKEQPKFLLQGEDLKKLRLLNVFEPCTLQVGDRNFYTLRDEDTYVMREQWRRSQRDLLASPSLINGHKIGSPKRNKNKTATEESSSESPSHTTKMDTSITPFLPPEVTVTSAPDEGEWDTEDTASMSDTASISSGCSSIGSQAFRGLSSHSVVAGKKKRGPALMTKVLKKKKLRRTKKRIAPMPLVPGTRVVVETLSTSSIANVVWQDGSVEEGIRSTQLYPIHHLDDQEFFPGDFVIENKEESCMRVYGVVQSVDHAGRTATVKWFKTYTSQEQPRPANLEESEVSVYDLKDHPDFQYRPGTVVIRVANFEGEDANCSAGQVLDNYPEGVVRVWWVDGHVSMCWPQDLYKVGEYDSDEGELWDDASSDNSWETESEDCFIADEICIDEENEETLKPKLAANIEKARIAMSRLEEIFTQNPSLQTTGVMRQLLDVYKDCRYLDKLMGTSFFHESHFQGLLERVRERGRANVAQRVADQVCRLFHHSDVSVEEGEDVNLGKCLSLTDAVTIPVEDSGIFSAAASNKDSSGSSGNESFMSGEFLLSENLVNLERKVAAASANHKKLSDVGANDSAIKQIVKKTSSDNILKIGQKNLNRCDNVLQVEHNYSVVKLNGHVGETPAIMVTPKNKATSSKTDCLGTSIDSSVINTPITPSSVSNSHVCVKLCSLIKAQLVKAHSEVTRRFGGNQGQMTLSDAFNTHSPVDVEDSIQEDASKEGQISDTSSVTLAVEESSLATGEDFNLPFHEIVKDGLKDMLNAFVRLKSSAVPCPNITGLPVREDEGKSKNAEEMEVPSTTIGEEGATAVPEGEFGEGFSIMDSAPSSHKFKLTMFQPTDPQNFFRTVRKELKLLRSSLPSGIWVKGFEDRMDLYSVMIRGPEKTPYEDGLFFFDFQLSAEYPKAPPLCHYISYCSDRLNPNLYEDGKVCVSLLGTWSGKGTEVWTLNSNLLQVIVSIQGLILVSEPYFNEAGYEKQKGSQQGKENSRMYNEMAVLKLVQALTKLIIQPPPVFKEEILQHFQHKAYKLIHRLDTWLEISERYNNAHPITPTSPTSFRELHGQAISEALNAQLPEFPLIPASKGFCLTLRKSLVTFRETLALVGITESLLPS